MIDYSRFAITRTSCIIHLFSSRYAYQRTFFLRRLLVYSILALSLCLAACGGQQDSTGGTMSVQQVERVNTGTTQRATVGTYKAQSVSGDYAGYVSLTAFIDEMVDKHGFDRDYLNGLFSEAQRKTWTLDYLTKSDNAMKRKPGTGGWTRYRAKFLGERNIVDGVKFANRHRAALQRASQQYGIAEEYILAILAVETKFGRNVGNHRVLDALTTLSFDYARRSDFFRSELEEFLVMTRNEGIDPVKPVGSYAGAMGLGQFMPSSFRQFAVDFNGDGRRDLWDPEDAIGSIANYFARHGWKDGDPVVTRLTGQGAVTLEPGIKKQYGLLDITQAGLYPVDRASTDGPFHLLLLRYPGHDQYLIGHPNFYTITRYNHSVYYAMAIHELAQAIKRRV